MMLHFVKSIWENLRETPIDKEYLRLLYRHLSDRQLLAVEVEGLSRDAREIWRAEVFQRGLAQPCRA
ncbi:MAG: hypothetical protein Q7P63_02185 [Verrucomicrobiota bacterium JB022]|nr:hypothetical protein [Verrucomicrobiota bacterium JB022]